MVWLSLAPKWPTEVPFCGMDHQKSNISLIFDTLFVGGCWGQPMSFFWKLVEETKMYEPPEATGHHKLLKLSILLPIRDNLLCTLQCETPCTIFFLWFPFGPKNQTNFNPLLKKLHNWNTVPDFFVVSHGLTMKADLINFSFLTSFLQILLIICKKKIIWRNMIRGDSCQEMFVLLYHKYFHNFLQEL